MKCGEIIEYLKRFGAEDLIGVVVVDVENRLHYRIGSYQLIDETPAMVLEVTDIGPMDEVVEESEERE
ncbi:MAG: hypothetical protein LUG13_04400 [Oscillospiraceae bacterium]|nr:hypothetical protein [Oscillospiraceae bacterium]